MANDFIRVERDGWFIDIETLDLSERPDWEIRCRIRRSKEKLEEQRGHRFIVSRELSERFKLGSLPEERRMELLTQAAKRVIPARDRRDLRRARGRARLRPIADGE